jgi:hypothetical protein
MKTDTLDDILNSIEGWCKTNGISVFYSDATEEDSGILWDKKTDEDWKKFLEVQKNADSKILILNILKNEIQDLEDEIKELQGQLEGPELQEFEDALKVLRKNEANVVSFELGFYYNNKCYRYIESSPWSNEYNTVMDYLNDSDDIVENKLEGIAINPRAEEYIKKITENKQYLSASNLLQRADIASHILLQEGIEGTTEVFRITKRAEAIFTLEVKPKLDEERKNLVLRLKGEGWNKKQTMAKSGLGETIVDKYWHINDELRPT